jgi:hypothetical protein
MAAEERVCFEAEVGAHFTGRVLPKKPKKQRASDGFAAKGEYAKAIDRVKAMIAASDFAGARGIDFVALYAHCYVRVYGSEPAALTAEARKRASFMASAMLKKQFRGEVGEMEEFVRWCWQRERELEKWRAENGRESGKVIDWYAQFNGRLLDEYRVFLARKARGESPRGTAAS